MRRIVLVIGILCGFAAVSAAEDCAQILPFNAFDQKTGNMVASLRPELLQARLGGMAVRITGIAPVEHRRVLVLVDKSGSMAPQNSLGSHQKETLEVTENTLTELLKELPHGVSVAYGFFNDKTAFTEGFFRDPKELQQAIAATREKLRKPDEGGTALFDALHQAILRFETPQPGDVIVLLSDGGENKSKLTEGEFEKEMRRSGVRLALLFLNQHSTDYAEPFLGTIISLAEDTGGAVSNLDINDRSWANKKDVAANREAIRKFWMSEVLGGYTLQVQVPANFKKAKKWKVQLNAGTDVQLKHVTLQYPVKLEPCPVKTAEAH